MANLAEYGAFPKFEDDDAAEAFWTKADGTATFENTICAPIYMNTTDGTFRVWNSEAQATGQITTGAKATFDDGDLFVTTDGEGTTVTFEIDVTGGNTPAAGNVEIDISATASAADVADEFRTAIEANLAITADAPGTDQIDMTMDTAGVAGRQTMTYTPAVAGTGVTIGSQFVLAWQQITLT